MWQPTVCLPAVQVRRKKRGQRAHPCKTRWQGSELINVCNKKKKSLVKKICLTAAPGPSVVINWNTSLEHFPSSLLSHLLLLPLFPSLKLDCFFSLPWCLFPAFRNLPFTPPFCSSPLLYLPNPFRLFCLDSFSNERHLTVIVHFVALRLSEFPREEDG